MNSEQSTPARTSGIIAALALIVAILSLALNVVVIYNGTGKQAQFEGARERCLDDLDEFTEALVDLQYAATLTDDRVTRLLTTTRWAEIACFDDQLLKDGSAMSKEWKTRREQVYDMVVAAGSGGEISLPMRDRVYAMTSLTGQVRSAVILATEMGAWPWEQPSPATPTPSPSPTDRPWLR